MRRHHTAGGLVTALVITLGGSVAVPASSASTYAPGADRRHGSYTDWGAWEAVPTPHHVRFRACGTTVRVRTLVNTERVRTRRDAARNVYQQMRGALWVRLVDAHGRRSRALNVSGWSAPGGHVAFRNGRYMYDALGANIIFPMRRLDVVRGMPRAFVSQGPITLLSRPHARVRMLREPQRWVSVCRLLEGGKQPRGDRATGGYTDWSEWQASPLDDITHHICGTKVREHVVVNDEQARFRQDSHGNVYTQVRGMLAERLTARNGATTGLERTPGSTPPGGIVAYTRGRTKGDLLLDWLGRNEVVQDPAFGITPRIPEAAFSQGPLTGLSVNGHARLLREPEAVTNMCSMLR
jgi:hypothetical protein